MLVVRRVPFIDVWHNPLKRALLSSLRVSCELLTWRLYLRLLLGEISCQEDLATGGDTAILLPRLYRQYNQLHTRYAHIHVHAMHCQPLSAYRLYVAHRKHCQCCTMQCVHAHTKHTHPYMYHIYIYIYMGVCMYICIFIDMYLYTHIYIFVCVHVYIACLLTRVCVCVSVCACLYTSSSSLLRKKNFFMCCRNERASLKDPRS